MEALLYLLCVVALGFLVAQLVTRPASFPILPRYLPPSDSSQASVPSDQTKDMFERIGSLFQASQGKPMASAQRLWEGNASEVSRRLSEQGGVETSMEQAYLLQQAYN